MRDLSSRSSILRGLLVLTHILIDKVTGSLFALHTDHIKSTGLCGSECVFDLQELEFHICDLADRRNGEEDTRSVAEERQTTQAPQTPNP